MLGGTATLDGIYNLPARETSYLAQGADGTVGLIHKDIKGEGRGAGADAYQLFPFHQRFGEAGCVAHHAIDDTVEEELELPRDIAPVAGCADDDGVRLLNQRQHALGIVFGQDAVPLAATCHTAHAGLDLEVVGIDFGYFYAGGNSLLVEDTEHLTDESFLTGTAVDNK